MSDVLLDPTPKPENVKLAAKVHERQVFDLLKLLALENALFRVDDECVLEIIRMATEEKGGIVGIIEDDGKIVASIGLFLERFWYTKDWHVAEYWNFVHPDFRKSNYAKSLINFSKWINENMGLILNIGILSSERTEAKIRLYERSNLKKMGVFFMNEARFDANVAPPHAYASG
jgi:hypothetical protein